MSNGWDLNFGGQTIDDVDKSGGNPPDGFYRCKVHEATTDAEDGSMSFKFKVCYGNQMNRIIKGKLKNPRFAEDPEKAATMASRAKIFGVRLGLIKKEDEGKTVNCDYTKAVGVECVISLKSRTFDGRDGGKVTYQDIDYAGIYPLTHQDLDGPTRVSLGLPLLPGQSATDAKAGKPAKGGKVEPGAASGAPGTPPAQSADQMAAALFG